MATNAEKKITEDVTLKAINNNIKYGMKFAVVCAHLNNDEGDYYSKESVNNWLSSFIEKIMKRKIYSEKALAGLKKAGKEPKAQICDIELYIIAPYDKGLAIWNDKKIEFCECENPFTYSDIKRNEYLTSLKERGIYVDEEEDEEIINYLDTI